MNFIKIILILIINIFYISQANAQTSKIDIINFTKEEKEFIKKHPIIKFSDVEWEPFFEVDGNEHGGIFKDYYKLIEQRTGLKFEYVKFNKGVNFQLVLNALKNKEIDMIDGSGKTKNREAYALFSEPLMQVSLAIVSKNNKYNSFEEIKNKKIALAKGSTASEVVENLVKLENIIFTDGIDEALSLVYNNEVDIVIDNIVVLDYKIKRSNYNDILKIKAIDEYDFNIYALIRDDFDLLQKILNKAILSITKEELYKINNKLLLASIQSNKELEIFSLEEQNYIKDKTVKIGVLKDFYPFNYNENNLLQGYSYDFIRLIAEKTSLKFEYVVDSWDKLFSKFKNNEIDLIADISHTNKREEFTNFTKAYYEIPNVIFSRKSEFENYKNIESLKGKKIGITKNIYYSEEIKKLNLFEVIEFENVEEKIKALVYGKIDIAFNNLINAQRYISSNTYSNLKVIDELDWRIIKKEDLRFGINKNDEVLTSIINKAFDSITYKEKQNLLLKWFTNKEENKIVLEKEEEELLDKIDNITYCSIPKRVAFFQTNDSNQPALESDFIKLVEDRLLKSFKIIETKNLEESISFIKQKKCDLLSIDELSSKNIDNLLFTKPYFETSLVFVTNYNTPSIYDISLLENKKIAMLKDKVLIDYIRLNYPNLEIVEIDNLKEGVEKIKSKKVFAIVDNLITIGHYLQEDYNHTLKISATLKEKVRLNYALNQENKILYNILEKVVNNISSDDKQNIINKWFFIRYEKGFDYELFWKLIAVVFVVIIFFVYRNYEIKKLNKKLNKKIEKELLESKDKDKLIFHQNKMSSMGQMIETIAHQWRQPLTQINSTVLLIDDILFQKKINDPILEEKLLEIEKLTKYMSNTIDDFKSFIVNNKDKKIFNLKEVILDSINLLKPSLDFNGIEVETIFESKEYCLKGFPNELQHVILVILNNAKDEFQNNDIKRKKIGLVLKEENNLYEISIQDNAGGIKEENIEKIFEPYFTTKLDSQGTGLGLYISKKIIEDRMGGNIKVRNINNGALFKIILEKVKNV